MSVDTRTPRFDDQPALSMVKVPCDPAQVIVNHASFRVQLAVSSRPAPVLQASVPAMSGAGARRRAPVVWSGKSAPGDLGGTTGLLRAVREAGRTASGAQATASDGASFDGGATQVIPRLDLAEDTMPTPTVIGPRTGGEAPDTRLIPPVRQAVGAYDADPTGSGDRRGGAADGLTDPQARAAARRAGASGEQVRHAYYPDRRMNLGVVLLPLRVFLGFISIYAGMGKLCDPVYFDGGERGSMVTWLQSLQPWALAEPLRDFALHHPVGAGLTVAFLQVIVGVLTIFGLWQRFAACFGALLSAALLMTVSWRTLPAYDAPDIIYLAAWSPLIIAGAPVYSLDARLAGEAWRKLGPRSHIWQLRRRVLRRGALMATVIVGFTLILGSVLGGAVRSTTVVTVPGPGQPPANYLPGQPLPQESGTEAKRPAKKKARKKSVEPSAEASTSPTAERSTPEAARETSTAGAQSPTATQGARGAETRESPTQSEPQEPPSSTSAGPSASGGTTGGGEEEAEKKPGLVGGLLG
ncbi:DoxX family protein [Streptomyces sp. NPDC006879]|uniref:DoxX family protein n=1 Tax=Streptomyces sp. NPDC006879 TaxID=3364767 RepID=UPI00367C3330